MSEQLCGDECDGQMHECYRCGGDGYVLADCLEDSCCCVDPEREHGFKGCDVCGDEGYFDCPALAARDGVVEASVSAENAALTERLREPK